MTRPVNHEIDLQWMRYWLVLGDQVDAGLATKCWHECNDSAVGGLWLFVITREWHPGRKNAHGAFATDYLRGGL